MNTELEYTRYEDAPEAHKRIAKTAAMDYRLDAVEIGYLVGVEHTLVEKVLSYPPIKQLVKKLRASDEMFPATATLRLNEAIDLGLAQLDETLSDPETPVGIKLQIVIALLDRHPSGMFGQPRAEGNAKGA